MDTLTWRTVQALLPWTHEFIQRAGEGRVKYSFFSASALLVRPFSEELIWNRAATAGGKDFEMLMRAMMLPFATLPYCLQASGHATQSTVHSAQHSRPPQVTQVTQVTLALVFTLEVELG